MNRLSEETLRNLVIQARNYQEGDLQIFIDEVGYESWMDEFITGDEITEADEKEINEILEEIFDGVISGTIKKVFKDSYELREAALSLYDGGWRKEDKEQLISEYNLFDEDAEDLVRQLAEIEEENN